MHDVLLGSATEQQPISSGFVTAPGRPWSPPVAEELQPHFPLYEIRSLLGRGGMGAVYLAWQKSLSRHVAIKVMPPVAEDADHSYAERFKQEARSMAQLNHPGIIAVYDAGETAEGLLYFVMEYIEGTDVHQMVAAAGKLPPEHALAITAHVCEALAYAHAAGIIHRDIKPANIMVDRQGNVKVADFGLAKLATQDTGLTQTNMTMGTPDFVSPEALMPGMPLDGRADLYAVGVMLYQMLTGKIPRGAWLPASSMVPGLDPRWDEIIVKAMQMDREARHSSAVELRQHLDSLQQPKAPADPLKSRPQPAKPKNSVPTYAMIAATFTILATGALVVLKPKPQETPAPIVSKAALISESPQVNAASPVSNPDPWLPFDVAADSMPTTAIANPDGSWLVKKRSIKSKKTYRDVAVRANISIPPGRVAQLALRGDVGVNYQAKIESSGYVIIYKTKDGIESKLASFNIPNQFHSGGDDLAFSAVGNELTVWIADQRAGSVTDDEFKEGTLAYSGDDAVFRNLQFQNINSSVRAAQTLAQSDTVAARGWTKLDPEKDCWPSTGTAQVGDLWQITRSRIRTKQGFKDCAIRALVDAPCRSQGIAVRIMEEGFYQLSLKGDDVLLIRVNTSVTPFKYDNIKVFPEAAADLPENGATLGLSAVGNVLSATLGNLELGSITDDSFPSGAIGCVAAETANFRDIEFQVFDLLERQETEKAEVADANKQQPAELTALQTQYSQLIAERVTAIFNADVAKLNASYLGGLERAEATEQAKGHLEAVLAIQAEKKRITASEPVPPDDASTPQALKDLRVIYRDSLSKLEEQRSTNHTTILTPYITRLKQLEADFTKAGRIQEAVSIKEYREGLNTTSPTIIAKATTSSGARPGESTSYPEPSGDTRSIAEWILGLGGRIYVGNNQLQVSEPGAIPKGKLDIRQIRIDLSNAKVPPLRDTDFDRLAALRELEYVDLNQIPITGAALRFIESCPKVSKVAIHNIQLGMPGHQYLSRLKKLKIIDFNNIETDGDCLKLLITLPLTSLNVMGSHLSNDDLAPISSMKDLKSLNLSINPELTDDGLIHLKSLPLEHLYLQNTNISLEALLTLQGMPLISLGWGSTKAEITPATFARIASVFPNVTQFSAPRDREFTHTDFEALVGGLPKLKSLYLHYAKLGANALTALQGCPDLEHLDLWKSNLADTGVPDLQSLKKLTSLRLSDTPLTDSCINELAGIKSLKKINLRGSKVSEAGLAAFKKARPDLMVER